METEARFRPMICIRVSHCIYADVAQAFADYTYRRLATSLMRISCTYRLDVRKRKRTVAWYDGLHVFMGMHGQIRGLYSDVRNGHSVFVNIIFCREGEGKKRKEERKYIYSRVNSSGERSLVAVAESISRWTFRFYSPRSTNALGQFCVLRTGVPLFFFSFSYETTVFFIALSCLARVDC